MGQRLSKELIIEFSDNILAAMLFGEYNDHLSYLEKKLDIHISDRGNLLRISGKKDAIQNAQIILQSLFTRLKNKELLNITHADIDAEIRFLDTGKQTKSKKIGTQSDKNEAKSLVIKTKKQNHCTALS